LGALMSPARFAPSKRRGTLYSLQVVAEGARAAPEPSAEAAGLRSALHARYRTLIRHSLMSVPPPPIGGGEDAPIRGYTGCAGGGGGEAAAAGGAGGGEEGGSVWRRQQRAAAGATAAAAVDGPADMTPAQEEEAMGMAEAAAEAVALLTRDAPPPRARRLFRRVATAPAEAEGAPPPHALLAREWRAHARAAPPPLGALAARAAAQAEAVAVAAVAPPPPHGAARYRLARRWEAEGVEVVELRPEFNTDVVHARHLEMLRAALGDEMVDSDIAELLGGGGGPETDAEGVKAEVPPPQRAWAIYVEVRAVAVHAACVPCACRVLLLTTDSLLLPTNCQLRTYH
jgi:hypothetical protein